MAESSIAVPLSAVAASKLAAGCKKLRSLRLCLGSSDVTAEGLAELRQFSSLCRWAGRAEHSIVVIAPSAKRLTSVGAEGVMANP